MLTSIALTIQLLGTTFVPVELKIPSNRSTSDFIYARH